MQIENLTLYKNAYETLVPMLIGRVFHLTKADNIEKIHQDGFIDNNYDERYGLNTGSLKSFGRLMKYVCLFDFRNLDEEKISGVHDCYSFSCPTWFRRLERDHEIYEMAVFFLSPRKYSCVIPNETARTHMKATGTQYMYIPTAEVWIKDRLPIDFIEHVLNLRIVKRVPDSGVLRVHHELALQNRKL